MLGVNAIQFCDNLSWSVSVAVINRQLIRAATSVGANYRAACRSRSRKEFISKLSLVEEEADEVRYWLEVMSDLGLGEAKVRRALYLEAGELIAIVVASKKTARLGL